MHREESTHVGAWLGTSAATGYATHASIGVSYDGVTGGIDVQDLLLPILPRVARLTL